MRWLNVVYALSWVGCDAVFTGKYQFRVDLHCGQFQFPSPAYTPPVWLTSCLYDIVSNVEQCMAGMGGTTVGMGREAGGRPDMRAAGCG